MNVLVTGSAGFIGQNVVAWLEREHDCHVLQFDQGDGLAALKGLVSKADFVLHLAGVNRPQHDDEFLTGNIELTELVCEYLLEQARPVPLVLTSSVQAALDNPYGKSKRAAEQVVTRYGEQSGARVAIYRLKNVFGKWSRPNYNSVVATFCHNIAHDLPITISDPERALELVYIDDVVGCFRQELQASGPGIEFREVSPCYQVTLEHLAWLVGTFRQMRQTLLAPDFADSFTRKLYATYLSYLEPEELTYNLEKKCDDRGCLAEFVKSASLGQIFISRTAPGVTRGNHYHHTKTEKFLVLEGNALIRLRHIQNGAVIEFAVSGEDFRVVDIPPGYTHSIENIGKGELVTLFWASEMLDPQKLDTRALQVLL